MTFMRAGESDGEAPGSTSPVESPNRESALGSAEASGIEGTSLAALTNPYFRQGYFD